MSNSDVLRRIFVGSIPEVVTESEVRAAGGRYGTLVAFHYVPSARGWALLTYSTAAEAATAIEGINGKLLFASCQVPLAARIANDKKAETATLLRQASGLSGATGFSAGTLQSASKFSFTRDPVSSATGSCLTATNGFGFSDSLLSGRTGFHSGTADTGFSAIGSSSTATSNLQISPTVAFASGEGVTDSTQWLTYYTPEGHPYYFNILTKQTQWEKPTEQVMSLQQAILAGRSAAAVGSLTNGVVTSQQQQQLTIANAVQSYAHQSGFINPFDLRQTATVSAQSDFAQQLQHHIQQQQQQQANPSLGARKFGPPGCNLFVFHIPSEWGNAELYEHFKFHGNIVSARVKTGDDNAHRNLGFGFVSYDTQEATVAAIKAMHGFHVGGKWLKVTLKKGEEHLLPASVQALYAKGVRKTSSHFPQLGSLFASYPTYALCSEDSITAANKQAQKYYEAELMSQSSLSAFTATANDASVTANAALSHAKSETGSERAFASSSATSKFSTSATSSSKKSGTESSTDAKSASSSSTEGRQTKDAVASASEAPPSSSTGTD